MGKGNITPQLFYYIVKRKASLYGAICNFNEPKVFSGMKNI